jgi:hypothetical protein
MARKADAVKQIDMTNMTVQELAEIRNEVLRNLALRRFGEGTEPTPIGPYDKHSSVHTKNSTELIEVGGQLLEPIRLRPTRGVAGLDEGVD